MKDRNIVGPKYDEETERGMFYDEDVLEPLLPGDRSLGHLLVRLGKFQSVGDAFRNGWNKPIPTGWNQYEIGKGVNRLALTIWNPSMTAAEYKEANPHPVLVGTDHNGDKWYETDEGETISEAKYRQIVGEDHPSDEGDCCEIPGITDIRVEDYPTFDVGC